MFRSILLCLFILPLLIACSSGKTAFKREKYDLAVQRASKRLEQRPGFSKRGHELATQVLKQAFTQAYEQHQTAIRQLSAPSSQVDFRWERVFREYEQLQALTDNARRGFDQRRLEQTCADCIDWLVSYPTSYQTQQQETRQLAAADRYEAAEQAFAYRESNRLAAKDAYLQYRKTEEWVADYKQAKAKAADAFAFAILRVAIEPLGPTRALNRSDNQELEQLIFQEISRNTTPSTFVQLYSPKEMARAFNVNESTVIDGFPIHQAVQMQVTDYSPYNETTSSSSTTVYSNQTYKVGEKKINDSTKVDIMEKVQGTLTTYVRTISAGLTLQMRAIDTQNGKVLWDEPVWESRTWQTEWQSFSGDDRALNGQSLKSANLFPPSRWSLYNSMRDELAVDVANRLQSNYRHD
ncbi:hypothetical protein GCM10028805_45820 [Spirosoma harenae]